MDNQKKQPAFNPTNGMPAVFIIFNPIKTDKTTWVKKHHFCSIKANPVLCLIDPVLIFIPFKNHALSVSITYNIVNIKNSATAMVIASRQNINSRQRRQQPQQRFRIWIA